MKTAFIWIRMLVLSLAAAAFLPGCVTNPATGESYLMLLSREEEVALGEEAAPQFAAEFGGAVSSQQLRGYVESIGGNLAAQTEADYPQLPWEFTLLDSDVINAFALPGGKVFVTRGLASKLENEAEIAGVLGHEVGHVTAQHANRRISKQLGFNIILAGLSVVATTSGDDSTVRQTSEWAIPALAIGGNLVLLKYGRDEELEADRLGMRDMTRVGYDPRGQLRVMQVLQEAGAGAERPPEFLSTHPYPERRIAQIESLLETEYSGVVGDPSYRFYEDRYRRQLLQPLTSLPASSHPPSAGTALAGDAIDLARPVTWCAHCAGE